MEDTQTAPKQRHGCVTAWLVLLIIANSFTALSYLVFTEFITQNSGIELGNLSFVFALLGIANIIFAAMLFKWRKIGFFGFVISSVIALVLNLYIGLPIGSSLGGLVGVGILFAVLQIRQNDVPAWEHME